MSSGQIRRALDARRAAAEARRTAVAAGISRAMLDLDEPVRRALRSVTDSPDADGYGADVIAQADDHRDELARALLAAAGEAFHRRFVEALGAELTDLTDAGGSIAGGVAGQVVVDTRRALLVDGLAAALLDEPDQAGPIVAVMLSGRVNLTPDPARLVAIMGVDVMAAMIVRLYALATEGGFLPALDAAIDQATAALPEGPPA